MIFLILFLISSKYTVRAITDIIVNILAGLYFNGMNLDFLKTREKPFVFPESWWIIIHRAIIVCSSTKQPNIFTNFRINAYLFK